METSAAAKSGFELVATCTVHVVNNNIEWVEPGLNSRPGLYLLKDAVNPRPLNETSFCSEEASIRGDTGLRIHDYQCCIQKMWLGGQTESFQNVGG